MKSNITNKGFEKMLRVAAAGLLTCGLSFAVTPNSRTFPADQQVKVQGVIVSREGDTIKLRADDDSIGTVDITDNTKIQLKHGLFNRKTAMDTGALVPGLRVEAQGRGNEKGELVAEKVIFDPNSMRASRQIDTRVSPLESRTGSLEGRAGTLESRAGQMESRQGQLEDQQNKTQTQVGQVKTEADQATQGVSDVNNRVTNLDNYQTTDSVTVYFKFNSAVLSADAKRDLDSLAQKAQAQKGYMIEVAGFADTKGKADRNQVLSQNRADAVTRYLEQQGNIPIHRILSPAGMGTSHEAAPNDTADGRKMNRRVEVKVLVNQGVVAGSNQPDTSGTKPPGSSSK
jgi:outer membrane protein OmpA-like peptidoglycan-associated protein